MINRKNMEHMLKSNENTDKDYLAISNKSGNNSGQNCH